MAHQGLHGLAKVDLRQGKGRGKAPPKGSEGGKPLVYALGKRCDAGLVNFGQSGKKRNHLPKQVPQPQPKQYADKRIKCGYYHKSGDLIIAVPAFGDVYDQRPQGIGNDKPCQYWKQHTG